MRGILHHFHLFVGDMDDQEIPMILPPFDLLFLPPGTYGISYDISTSKTENNLPEGRRIMQQGEL